LKIAQTAYVDGLKEAIAEDEDEPLERSTD